MYDESPVRRICNRAADLIVLALLVVVTSLPLVTGFAAVSAAAAVLGDTDERPLVRRFGQCFGCRWRASLPVQLAVLVVAAVSIADLGYAASAAGQPMLRAAVGSTGVLLALAVLTVPVFAAVLDTEGTRSRRRLLLDAAALAAGRATASALILSLDALALALGWVAPALTSVLLGLVAVVALQIARRSAASTVRRALSRPVPELARN